jgi:CRISPR/Cas system-associated exonuclease Cas4 (RecB family)
VLLEHKFAVPLGAHTLVGALDRVDATDAGYEVIDYKLERDVRTQEAVDDDLQLALYHLALEEGQGISPDALTLYFLRHNIQRTTSRTQAQSADLARWVISTGDEISRQRQWLPCVGEQCAGCDFRAVCPAHTGEPLPPPTAQRLESAQLSLSLRDGESDPQPPADGHVDRFRQLILPLS